MIEFNPMYDLPLFPLNTVLFPGTPLQLHIFEERYKLMIGKCIDERSPFGVVLIQEGMEARGPLAKPHSIGCSAQIIHVQRLSQGRLNIVSMGESRFRILSVDESTYPYLTAKVEKLSLQNPKHKDLDQLARNFRPQVIRFIQSLVKAGSGDFDIDQLPDDPITLAYTAAAILQNPPIQKQQILAIDQAENLLASLQSALKRENAFLKVQSRDINLLQSGGFSKN